MQFSGLTRTIDRLAGIGICFLLTIIHALRPRPKNKTLKKVLVIELFEMGAAVMAYSSLKYIKESHQAEIYCLCLEKTKESWLTLGIIQPENIFAIKDQSLPSFLLSLIKNIFQLSRENIDVIIDFELFTRISSIVSFFIWSKFRSGFYSYTMDGLYRGNFLDVKCYLNQNMHISKNLLALTKSAMTLSPHYYNWNEPIHNTEIVAPTYVSDPRSKRVVMEKLREVSKNHSERPYILVAPTVGKMLPMRDYPKEFYVEIVKQLLKKYPTHKIILIGTQGQTSVSEYILKNTQSDRCINFCGQTATLRELLELMSGAELLISNDSGNPHFAAMVNLKTLVIFGPETPFVYGPLGKAVCLYSFFHTSPSITAYNHKNPPSIDTECLRSIHPNTVVETAETLLNGTALFGTINNKIPYLL